MGSPAITKMGISRVACFAAKAHGVKMAAMTSTLRLNELLRQLRKPIGLCVRRT